MDGQEVLDVESTEHGSMRHGDRSTTLLPSVAHPPLPMPTLLAWADVQGMSL